MNAYGVYVIYIKPSMPEWLHERAALLWRRLHAQRYLPQWLHDRCARLSTRYFLWRIKPLPTRVLGPLWRRSRNVVEVDITYACNLKCFNCNRSCRQDPTGDRMSLEQIRHFLEESGGRGIRWKRIRLLGGEPTSHPQFLEIANLVLEYRDEFSPRTRIEMITNSYGERANRMLSLLPPGVRVINTAKVTNVQQEFQTFNVAPIDVEGYKGADFSNGCLVTQYCGIGVTPYGYYPCAVAGAIDRTFGLNLGRKTLPDRHDAMKEELRTFCALCGHFKPPTEELLNGPVMSPTWAQAYARSLQDPARLSRLAEHKEFLTVSESAVTTLPRRRMGFHVGSDKFVGHAKEVP